MKVTKAQLLKLSILLCSVLLSSIGYTNPPTVTETVKELFTTEMKSDVREVVLPNGETATISTVMNYAILNIPRSAMFMGRYKSFPRFLARRELDKAWEHNNKASVEVLIVPKGRADQVLEQIDSVFYKESMIHRFYERVKHKVLNSPIEASFAVKDSLAWENMIRYNPNMSEEQIQKLPENMRETYGMIDQFYTGREHVLIGNFKNRSVKKKLMLMATARFLINGVAVASTTIAGGLLAPDATIGHAALAGLAPATFGAIAQMKYKDISELLSNRINPKTIRERLTTPSYLFADLPVNVVQRSANRLASAVLSESKNKSFHDRSELWALEAKSLIKQSMLAMSFMTLLSTSVVAVNHAFNLGADISYSTLMYNSFIASWLSIGAGYGFNKLFADRHSHDKRPSPRQYQTNTKNFSGILMLNTFITAGQVAMVVFEKDPAMIEFFKNYLITIGAIGFGTYMRVGVGKLPMKYQQFEQEVLSRTGAKVKDGISWVRDNFGTPLPQVCGSFFAQ